MANNNIVVGFVVLTIGWLLGARVGIGTILNAWDLKTMNRSGYGAYAPYESQ